MRPEREAHYSRFVSEYETVRKAEGRGSDDPAFYRALPIVDLTGKRSAEWRIRAESFRLLLNEVVTPLEVEQGPRLRILDLGAGNGWLSYQLARRGHLVTAVDLTVNSFDGLGAHVHYDHNWIPVQAEFDHLPLIDQQFHLAVFNSSLHYSTNYERTFGQALRVITPGGILAVSDTPVYLDGRSGIAMVHERQALFQRHFGFPSNAISSENFLTYSRLDALASALDVSVDLRWALPRWRRYFRRVRSRLRGEREAAQFPLLIVTNRLAGESRQHTRT